MRFNKLFFFMLVLVVLAGCSEDSATESLGTGQGGSTTRFAINGNFLYVVDRSSIQVFDITGENFAHINDVEVGGGMETIFARGEYLYLGALDAMYIYSISDPRNPSFVFRYQHIVSCDPVVVQGNRAYVTLRTGTSCNVGENALEIIDISDPYEPHLIKNYPMTSPGGLGVRDNLLFICEGEYGVKVLDISNENSPQIIHAIENLHAYDVIVKQNQLIITGEDGIFQYTFTSDGTQFQLISKITVNRTEV